MLFFKYFELIFYGMYLVSCCLKILIGFASRVFHHRLFWIGARIKYMDPLGNRPFLPRNVNYELWGVFSSEGLRVVSRYQKIFSSTRDQSLALRLLCASDKLVILLLIQQDCERHPIVFNFRLFTMSFDNPIILQVIYEAIDVSLPGIPPDVASLSQGPARK